MEEEPRPRDDDEHRAMFHRLVLETRGPIMRYAHYLSLRDSYLAEDLYSEALLSMYQSFPRLDKWDTPLFVAYFKRAVWSQWRRQMALWNNATPASMS